MFNRILKNKLPKESFFLFGPRQTGKSTLLNQLSRVFSVDLLDPEKQLAYTQHPNLLAQQIEAGPHEGLVFIDGIQRVPKLLDVIHHLVEKYPALYFAMSGSSARKPRHGAANFAQQINYTEVARQCAVAYATVREYYAILEKSWGRGGYYHRAGQGSEDGVRM